MTAPAKIESGIRKAAVLLMSMDEEDATAMMRLLPPNYVEKVSLAIAQLDTVSGSEQENVMLVGAMIQPAGVMPECVPQSLGMHHPATSMPELRQLLQD